MRHVPLVPHEALVAVVAPKGKVSRVPALVADELVSVPELLLTVLASVSEEYKYFEKYNYF